MVVPWSPLPAGRPNLHPLAAGHRIRQLAVVRVRGEVVTFKQIRLDAKELHRFNDAYLGREFSYEKVEIIGRVIQ